MMEIGPKTSVFVDLLLFCLKEVTENSVSCLKALTENLKVQTALMGIEYQEILAKQEQEQKTQERQEQGQGMMRAPYGYCPECGAKGVQRHRSSATDMCVNGHRYPSNTAVLRFDKENTEERSDVNNN